MWVIIILLVLAFICELTDSAIGMMYGTLLSPMLILAGFSPFHVIPSLLLSQAIGGFIATYRHNKFKNAELNRKSTDTKIAGLIIGLGIIAVIIGAFIGSIISPLYLKAYIGILCVAMGSMVLRKHKFNFSWLKIAMIGLISSFNKALSSGGFGPIVATGNIASGVETKRAIAITDFAEAPICVMSFIAWLILSGTSIPINLMVPLCIGAGVGGYIGPKLLFKSKSKQILTRIVGSLALISGLIVLVKLIL